MIPQALWTKITQTIGQESEFINFHDILFLF